MDAALEILGVRRVVVSEGGETAKAGPLGQGIGLGCGLNGLSEDDFESSSNPKGAQVGWPPVRVLSPWRKPALPPILKGPGLNSEKR